MKYKLKQNKFGLLGKNRSDIHRDNLEKKRF